MIIRIPAPTREKKNEAGRVVGTIVEDVWAMVFLYRCYLCLAEWSMNEEDLKPEFCPYCGKDGLS